jgi:GNAT superfamily N-acetyltransferase
VITVQEEKFSDVYEEAKPLLEEHWGEIATYSDIKLDVDFDAYKLAEEAGFLRVFTVRSGTELVGYLAAFIRSHVHYKQSLQSFVDVVFLKPEYRNAGVGKTLIEFTDKELREEGVQVNYHHVKLRHPALGKLLEYMGYEAIETTYARRLAQWQSQEQQ